MFSFLILGTAAKMVSCYSEERSLYEDESNHLIHYHGTFFSQSIYLLPNSITHTSVVTYQCYVSLSINVRAKGGSLNVDTQTSVMYSIIAIMKT